MTLLSTAFGNSRTLLIAEYSLNYTEVLQTRFYYSYSLCGEIKKFKGQIYTIKRLVYFVFLIHIKKSRSVYGFVKLPGK